MSDTEAPEETDGPTDGRRRRSERSKHKIAQAMIELIMEGDMTPSAEAVAARAKVGLRSVFRHFKDMDSLFNEVSTIFHAEYLPDLVEVDQSKEWQDQLQDVVDLRCKTFEKVMPMQQSTLAQKHRSRFVQEEMARNNALLRKTLLQVLPDTVQAREDIVEGLNAILSPTLWMRLRLDQGLTTPKSKATIETMVDALLKTV